jgi:hypothetical protein
LSASAPPTNGPAIAATPKTADMSPKYAGRRDSGITLVVMRTPPEKIPDAPRPAIARPKINAVELGAVVQIRDPISNSAIAVI